MTKIKYRYKPNLAFKIPLLNLYLDLWVKDRHNEPQIHW